MDTQILPSDEPASQTPWSVWAATVVWLASLEFTISNHRVGLYVTALVAIGLITFAIFQWRQKSATNVAALSSSLTLIISLGGLSFAPGFWPQQIVAIISAMLLLFIGQQRLRQHDDLRGRTTAFTTALLLWLSWFSLLSASIYLDVYLAWLILAAATMTSLAGLLVWLETGISWRQSRLGLMAMFWLGAELFVVTWWLPTTTYVGSSIATTILALVIQANRHLLKDHWESGRAKRYLVIGTVILTMVLLSARWI